MLLSKLGSSCSQPASCFTYTSFIELPLLPQAWRWVAWGVKRTRAHHSSTGPKMATSCPPTPTWATMGPTPPGWVTHQPWRCTTTATTVTLLCSRPSAAPRPSWRPSAERPRLSPRWLWAAPSPASSQVSGTGAMKEFCIVLKYEDSVCQCSKRWPFD